MNDRGTDTDTSRSLAGLDQFIEQVRADWGDAGVAVAVVRGSEVIYSRGFGVREHDKAEKVDADTLFQIGSTSKAFTAAALGILVDEGKVGWDDPVVDHFPGFQLQDPWLTRHLTVRDAVAHRSGIADSWYQALGIVDSDVAVRQTRYSNLVAPFRASYCYSNLMYGVAGKVIEAVSGMSWHDFVKRRLLRPLKMNRSGTSPYDFWDAQYVTPTYMGTAPSGRVDLMSARDANVAMPHCWDEKGAVVVLPWQSYDNLAGAGAIVSSAADLAHWLILHLNEGRFEGQQILKKPTLQELHAPQNMHGTKQFPFEEMTDTYTLGWRRAEHRGRIHLSHGGGIIGFPAYAALLPEAKMGVAVLCNGPASMRTGNFMGLNNTIAFGVFDRLLEAPGRNWSQEFLRQAEGTRRQVQQEEDELRRSRLENAPPSLPIEQYAGSYEDARGNSGPVSVRVEKGSLMLAFPGEGAFSAHLEHWHRDLFQMHSNVGADDVVGRSPRGQFVAFALDPAGKVTSMSAFGATFERR